MKKLFVMAIILAGLILSIFVVFNVYQQHQSQIRLAADTIVLADDFGENKTRLLCHPNEENDVVSMIPTPNGTTIQCPWNCEVIKDKCVYPLSDEQIVKELRKGPQGLTHGEQMFVMKLVNSEPQVQKAIEGKQYTVICCAYMSEYSQPPKYTLGILFNTDKDEDDVEVAFDLQTLKVSKVIIGSPIWHGSSGESVKSDLVVPRGDLFLQQPLRIEGLNQTQYVGQKIKFTVKFNGTGFGCGYPELKIEDSEHQKIWESGTIVSLCDPDMKKDHIEKEWKIGNTPLGTPIINRTGFYTLFAEFENDIIQHDFWVKSHSDVKIIGLEDTYKVGDNVKFYVTVQGFGMIPCEDFTVSIKNNRGQTILDVPAYDGSCPIPVEPENYEFYFPQKNDSYKLSVDQTGKYIVSANFGANSLEKEFVVKEK